jgi:hypothetical protein
VKQVLVGCLVLLLAALAPSKGRVTCGEDAMAPEADTQVTLTNDEVGWTAARIAGGWRVRSFLHHSGLAQAGEIDGLEQGADGANGVLVPSWA